MYIDQTRQGFGCIKITHTRHYFQYFKQFAFLFHAQDINLPTSNLNLISHNL